MSNELPTFSIPLRRMTQAELDSFLEKAADILRGNVDHSEFRGYASVGVLNSELGARSSISIEVT